jgi:hypothetical protein
MRRSPLVRTRLGGIVLAVGVLTAAAVEARPLRLRFDNGLSATIHPPEDLLRERTVRENGALWLVVDGRLRYQLVEDVADPVIHNKGDGRFHPMSVEVVAAALGAVRLQATALDIEIFVLPCPRREILDSSARDGRILLSPGTRPVSDYATHFTVTHEVGHVYQYRWLPDSDLAGWGDYAALRGIVDQAIYNPRAAHRDRPHEIFAEDFRFLFGGAMANYSASIENDALALPDAVPGLADFLRGIGMPRRIAALETVPNPFHPATEIRVSFRNVPAGSAARLRIFDAQGRAVRELYRGVPAERVLVVPWDGRDAAGARAASGVYFARLDYQGEDVATKLLLMR